MRFRILKIVNIEFITNYFVCSFIFTTTVYIYLRFLWTLSYSRVYAVKLYGSIELPYITDAVIIYFYQTEFYFVNNIKKNFSEIFN